MHDEEMTHIEAVGNEIRIEYANIGSQNPQRPCKKVTVTYFIDRTEGFLLEIRRLADDKMENVLRTAEGKELFALNDWHMLMDSFSLHLFGQMTLHFQINKDGLYRNADLTFTPTSIRYEYEE